MDLVISHVYKDFGRGPVLRDVSLTVRQGETVCLMGPSGLGKTTLLRCVAGLERPESGSITGVPESLAMCSRRTGCAASFPPWPTSAWQQAGPLPEAEVLRHLEEWAWPEAPGGRCRSCPAACAAGWPSPGRVRRAAASAAGRGLQGTGRAVPPGHRGLYPPPYARGVPAVRHPRPGGGRPAGGPLSGPVHPMIAIWNRKNVSHSETFR